MVRRVRSVRIVRAPPFGNPEEAIEAAVDVVRRGGVLGYPTETVYGIGGDATSQRVVNRICELKGRDETKPFIILAQSIETVRVLSDNLSRKTHDLMHHFWPGPLTLVMRSTAQFPDGIAGSGGLVAIRVSPDRICRRILEQLDVPLVSTSANPAGCEPAQTAKELAHYFPTDLDLIVDGGDRKSAPPSTVVDVSGTVPLILRRGAIPAAAIRDVAGELDEAQGA